MKDIRRSIPSTNYTRGRSRKIDTIVFHHIVGDAGAAIARFRKHGEQASSTYVIGSDGQVYYLVSEANTPYTNGNWQENSRSITIEHAGGHHSVPYTEKMYKASEKLVRDIRKRHGITRFLRHRDIVATACPGGLKVERILKNSKPGASKPTPKPKPKKGGSTVNESNSKKLVNALFKHLLGRNPDKGGFKNYYNLIRKGKIGFAVKDIAKSAEFKRKHNAGGKWKKKFQSSNKTLKNTRKALADVKKQVSNLKADDLQDELTKDTLRSDITKLEKNLDIAERKALEDDDTNEKVNALFSYFYDRWQTFKDFINRNKE